MVDNQNINARYVDKFGQGTSSVKLHAPPGGKSSFSLGWGDDTKTDDYKKNNNYSVYNNSNSNQNNKGNMYDDYNNQKNFKNLGGKQNNSNQFKQSQQSYGIHQTDKPSVKVKQAPGGASSITFG